METIFAEDPISDDKIIKIINIWLDDKRKRWQGTIVLSDFIRSGKLHKMCCPWAVINMI